MLIVGVLLHSFRTFLKQTDILMRFTSLLFLLLSAFPAVLLAQPDRWQQRANYQMNIDVDAAKNQYRGSMKLDYTNNSPDVLDKAFFHLYFNAFKPGSMMDVRSRTIADADPRVGSRISKLKPDETGWIRVSSLKINGKPVPYLENETILEVDLSGSPIAAGSTVTFEMEWDAQVPLQIRRSGRDSKEGIELSMTQWYPKLCEYDYQGWHANPYVAREFYGIWGDFDVKIAIDRNYVVAAGGYLQNPGQIGYGYETPGMTVNRPAGEKLTWHFKTPNVHDFAWAADPDYTQSVLKADDGSIMRFFWQKGKGYDEAWGQLPAVMNRARTIMNEHFGKYPYNEYAFIQGGDGGMEYPLATLITGDRPLNSLAGVAIHEQLHSWYQMILGTNESLYAWMDEGFTSYAETIVENELAREGLLPGREPDPYPFEGNYATYFRLAASGKEEPLTTHADHFNTNFAYSIASYVKGAVFLHQLEYVIGKPAFDRGLLSYFNTWKFKHPNVNDCIRVFEKESGLELDWYKEDWVNTLNTVDYGIKSVETGEGKSTRVVIERAGRMGMPLDILVTYNNGDQEMFYAPLESMRGEKPKEGTLERTLLPDHRWVDPEYVFEIPSKMKKIARIEIDPSGRMADVNRDSNIWEKK